MLPRNDKISILITFVIGFIFGIYLYFAGFMAFDEPDVPTVAELPTFTLEGEAYGGCARADTCPSFFVQGDGAYRFLYTPGFGEEQVVREGELPREIRTDINRSFTDVSLKTQGRKIAPALCNSYSDGIDVRYEIMIGGEIYTLDSCGTDIDVESDLWQTLVKLWNYFETQDL